MRTKYCEVSIPWAVSNTWPSARNRSRLDFHFSVSRLRPVIFSEVESDKEYINNSMTIGTGLFELYLALQSISKYLNLKYTKHLPCSYPPTQSLNQFNFSFNQLYEVIRHIIIELIFKYLYEISMKSV